MYLHPVGVLTSDRSVKLHFTPQPTPSHLDCKDNPSDQGGVVLNEEYQTIIYLLHSCLYQSVVKHFSTYTSGLWVRAGMGGVGIEGGGGRIYNTFFTHVSINPWSSIFLPILQACGSGLGWVGYGVRGGGGQDNQYLHHSCLCQSVVQHFSPYTSGLWHGSVRLLA